MKSVAVIPIRIQMEVLMCKYPEEGCRTYRVCKYSGEHMNKTIFILTISYITGCSHTYDIRQEQYHLYDVNRWVSGKEVTLLLQNGDSLFVKDLRLTIDTTFWTAATDTNRTSELTSKIHKVIFIDHQQGFIEGFLIGCASGVGLGVLSMAFGRDIDQSGIANPILRFIVVGTGTAIISTIIGTNKGSREEYIINHKASAHIDVSAE